MDDSTVVAIFLAPPYDTERERSQRPAPMDPLPRAQAALLPDLLASAESFATLAGDIVLRHYGGRVTTEAKADGTPVTCADRQAEAAIRRQIEERYPGHGILGEEHGEQKPGSPIRWIVDPIDGTRSFARGVPLFGILIGVEILGKPVVGVAHFPALGETVSAALGLGCSWNGEGCRVSDTGRLDEALVLTTDVQAMEVQGIAPGWEALVRAAAFSRTWGDCYGHILVATGRAEIMVDPVLSPWDAAPLLPILQEAGGIYTDLGGAPTILSGSGVSSNGFLHTEALEILRTSV